MKTFAPKTILWILGWYLLMIPVAVSAPSCQGNEVVGEQASANSWIAARRNARAKWISDVGATAGRSWSNWRFAKSRGYMCWESNSQKTCQAAAIACNGRVNLASGRASNDDERFGNGRDRNRNRDERGRQQGNDRDNEDRNVRDSRLSDKNRGFRSGYFDQRFTDKYAARQKCAGRSTRISGKVLSELDRAKDSARRLWAEYVDITKGKRWSRWNNARRRHMKCIPEGEKVKCEVVAVACLSVGTRGDQRASDEFDRRNGRLIALPVKRPDPNDFASFEGEASRDPGEYGDGGGDSDGRGNGQTDNKDGFSLPWLAEPPSVRPEPKDGEGGPFGNLKTHKDIEVSGLDSGNREKLNDPYGSYGEDANRYRRFKRQGSIAPALPVKRPRFKQAYLDRPNQKSGQYYGFDYQESKLNYSGAKGLSLPQRRPQKPSRNRGRRFSQNFNTDTDSKDEEDSLGGSKKKSFDWNTDSDSGTGRKRDRNNRRDDGQKNWMNSGKANERLRREDDRKKDVKQNWNSDSEADSLGNSGRGEKANDRRNRGRRNKKSRQREHLHREDYRKDADQNWNSDDDEQTSRRARGRSRKINHSGRNKKSRKTRRNQKRSRPNRRKNAQRNWNTDDDGKSENRDSDRGTRRNARERNSGRGRGRNARKRDAEKGRKNKFKGWAADDEADRNVTRSRGMKDGKPVKSKKFSRAKFDNSKIRYLSNSGEIQNPNFFYGCKEEEVASWGKEQPTKPQARQEAIRSWQKVIYQKFGKNWSDWMKAGSSRVQCGTQKGMKKCVAIAKPCGAVMLKKADDYTATARCRIYALTYKGDSDKDLEQAKQNAMNVWEKKIGQKYGEKWSDWFRSMDNKISCKRRRGKNSCQAKAIPCSS